jgi:hypothetical protein
MRRAPGAASAPSSEVSAARGETLWRNLAGAAEFAEFDDFVGRGRRASRSTRPRSMALNRLLRGT